MALQDRQLEMARRLSQLPIYQLYGLFGLNPYANMVKEADRRQLESKKEKAEQVVDSSIAGLDQLVQQLQEGQGNLFSLASSMALGQGASTLRSVAGMSGVSGSGLQALGGSQLASSVMAQLASSIAQNQLQRTQLQAGLLTGKAGLATRQEQLLFDQQAQKDQLRQQQSAQTAKFLATIAKLLFL